VTRLGETEALFDEAPGDRLVNVSHYRESAKHRARESHTVGVLIVV
jgi:hypothetical protein